MPINTQIKFVNMLRDLHFIFLKKQKLSTHIVDSLNTRS